MRDTIKLAVLRNVLLPHKPTTVQLFKTPEEKASVKTIFRNDIAKVIFIIY